MITVFTFLAITVAFIIFSLYRSRGHNLHNGRVGSLRVAHSQIESSVNIARSIVIIS